MTILFYYEHLVEVFQQTNVKFILALASKLIRSGFARIDAF